MKKNGKIQNGVTSAVIDSGEFDLSDKPLAMYRKILFGLAAPPLQMTGNICGFFFSLYLLEVVHLSPVMVSVISFTGRLWDAVTDPVVGQLVFRTKTRFGRTKPWLLSAAIVGSLLFAAMWTYNPLLESDAARFAYYFVLYLLYCTLITCYHVPYTASTVLLSRNPRDKDGATAWRTAFELVFTIVGCGAFGVITGSRRIAAGDCGDAAGNGTAADEMVQAERHAYAIGGLTISSIYLSAGLVAAFGIRERVPPDSRRESLLTNVTSVLKFKPYLLLMFAFLFMSLGIQIVQANLALYVTHSINMASHTNYGIVNVLGVAAICIPFWYTMAAKFGKKIVFFAGLGPLLPCLVYAMFMPAESPIPLYIVTTVSGLSVSVAMLMPWSMLPDVIDDFYCQHGERKEATFYSLYVFFTKFAAGISLAVSQLTLSVSNYDSHKCTQPQSVGDALRMLVGPAPILCIVVSLALIWKYPIDKKYRLMLNQKLLDKRCDALMIEQQQNGKQQQHQHELQPMQQEQQQQQQQQSAVDSGSSTDTLAVIDSSANLLENERRCSGHA